VCRNLRKKFYNIAPRCHQKTKAKEHLKFDDDILDLVGPVHHQQPVPGSNVHLLWEGQILPTISGGFYGLPELQRDAPLLRPRGRRGLESVRVGQRFYKDCLHFLQLLM